MSTTSINQNRLSRNDDSLILAYLLDNVPEFRQLTELRDEGWNNPDGDRYFARQRQAADHPSAFVERLFYNMMKQIGEEMHQATGALEISDTTDATILDLCMAPGGFLAVALEKNPAAHALGLSLPRRQGGHPVQLRNVPNMTLEFLDVTMLAADMGVTEVPTTHPDASNFLPQLFHSSQLFNLVLCDGAVLRTHRRAAYREEREVRRLRLTQLAIGLEHLKSGGTIIVRLHKFEAPENVALLSVFSKFSSVKLFKPVLHHAKRSSVYMVATNVQPQHEEATRAVKQWKRQWRAATFGSDAEYEEEFGITRWQEERLLMEFGEELVRLGRDAWTIQLNALRNAPFMRNM